MTNINRIYEIARAAAEEADAANEAAARVILADESHRRPGGGTKPSEAWLNAREWLSTPGYESRPDALVEALESASTREELDMAIAMFEHVSRCAPAHIGPKLPDGVLREIYNMLD